jgi:hypothetical protein
VLFSTYSWGVSVLPCVIRCEITAVITVYTLLATLDRADEGDSSDEVADGEAEAGGHDGVRNEELWFGDFFWRLRIWVHMKWWRFYLTGTRNADSLIPADLERT